MGKDDEPVSFTDTNAETGAGGNKATGSAMMDLISGLQKEKGSRNTGGDSTASFYSLLAYRTIFVKRV
ncbi:unnamed protein product [Nippostrongylus brasiliensis]|uniref:Flagellar hook capping protein n=1 Tax=Nippostrongylus brasiliensis TaxID=27835 RepID=A0A0N4YG58_NIPBR|nr:unnamed protein product [Nippostrongylus brasiliensis]